MKDKSITVSILSIAYNHEKYIKDALDGFVSQQTSFGYEVLINDDASTDDTAKIISEYQEKYSDIIKPVFQYENQYSKKIPIIKTFLLPKAKGKYYAICEGDDYWIDTKRLQMQVDMLEKHPECVACFNKVQIVNQKGKPTGFVLPPAGLNLETGVIKSKDYLSIVAHPGLKKTMAFQFSGILIRADIYKDYVMNKPEYANEFDVGDLPLFLYLGTRGDVYYINDAMSCYRTQNPNSWAGNVNKSKDKVIAHCKRESAGLLAFDNYSNEIVHEAIVKGANTRKFIALEAAHDIRKLKANDMISFYKQLPLSSRIKHHLFHLFPFLEPIWLKIRQIKAKLGILRG